VEVLHLSGGTKSGTSLIPPPISVGFERKIDVVEVVEIVEVVYGFLSR
jgi:hypothetical protein